MNRSEAEAYWNEHAAHVEPHLREFAVAVSEQILRVFPAATLAEPTDGSGYTSVWLDGFVIASLHPKAKVTGLSLRMPLGRAEYLKQVEGLDITIEDPERRGAAWVATSFPRRLSLKQALALTTEAMETERRASLTRALSEPRRDQRDDEEGDAYRELAGQLDDEEGDNFDASTRGRRRREQGHLRNYLLGDRDHAPCAFCGEVLPKELLWAAHIFPRRFLSPGDRGRLSVVAVLACRLACDPLYESGYFTIDDAGRIEVTSTTGISVIDERLAQLSGRPMARYRPESADFFARHRAERFRVPPPVWS